MAALDLNHALVGSTTDAAYAALKAASLFLLAVVAFRCAHRRSFSSLTAIDLLAAGGVGAALGRTATARDTPWLTGAAVIVTFFVVHGVLSRWRLTGVGAKLLDPPARIVIRDGEVDALELRRAGLDRSDLEGAARQRGLATLADVHLAVVESKGVISLVARDAVVSAPATEPDRQ